MSPPEERGAEADEPDDLLERLGASLGYPLRDRERAFTALSHSSYAHEVRGDRGNERLEFLGDAVLDLVVAEALYAAHPDWSEGKLTRARASLVRREALAERARAIDLAPLIRLGRTERRSGGAEKDSILANAFEAVIGALYLEGGLEPVRALVAPWLAEDGGASAAAGRDAKTAFQEWAHASLQTTPTYHLVRDSSVDDDDARFTIEVHAGGECWGRGTARSKRLAERAAAEDALERVRSSA